MKGGIFFTGKFGSTEQYARWIADETSLPVFDLNKEDPDVSSYDFLILGSSMIIEKLTIRKWLRTNWPKLKDKSVLLYSVSGTAADHPELLKWVEESVPDDMLEEVRYIPLRGRLNPKELPWWVRLLLKVGANLQKNPETKRRMEEGFDHMDKSGVYPIIGWAREMKYDAEEAELVH